MQVQISWLLQKPTDLDLHCLQRQGISVSAGQGLIFNTVPLPVKQKMFQSNPHYYAASSRTASLNQTACSCLFHVTLLMFVDRVNSDTEESGRHSSWRGSQQALERNWRAILFIWQTSERGKSFYKEQPKKYPYLHIHYSIYSPSVSKKNSCCVSI